MSDDLATKDSDGAPPDGAAYRLETIRFPSADSSGGGTIVGCLCLPVAGHGPHPAAVFVHGSGPTTRDNDALYPPLWEAFARRGYASLSWDKPGVGDSTGDWSAQTPHARADEVLAAIRFLRQRDDVDGDAIGMWGLSQAGWVMPLVCARMPGVAFVIAVSVPVGTATDQKSYRLAHQLLGDGFSSLEARRAVAFRRLLAHLIATRAPHERVVELASLVGDARWSGPAGGAAGADEYAAALADPRWEWGPLSLDPMRCPALAIFGERDIFVDVRESAAAYEALPRRTGNRDVTVRIFPDGDHVLFHTVSGGWDETLENWRRRRKPFVPGYLDLMADWLERHRTTLGRHGRDVPEAEPAAQEGD